MTELKIVMDDYGLLYAILPDGSKRTIQADIFGNPYYGVVRTGNEPEEDVCLKLNSARFAAKLDR